MKPKQKLPDNNIEIVGNQEYELTPFKQSRDYWHMLGPGLTTGASDDDPSGIATYSQAGAGFGFGLLWTALATFPIMAIVQEMCARIGIVTGQGLAANIRTHFSKKVIYVIALLLFAANTFNIGADLAAMGQVGELLAKHISAAIFIFIFAILTISLEVMTSYKDYAKYLKWLALILVAYVISAFSVHIDWAEALKHTVLPDFHFGKTGLLILSAVVGTTVSPYLFFWQTSQEVEEQILSGKKTLKQRMAITTPADVRKMRVDVWSGMLISNVIMFFIIVASAAALFSHGITNIGTASQAAEALRPFAGEAAYFLFAMGIIGTGLLAIPVLAGSSSYAITESLGLREGLYRKFKRAYAFYSVIIVSIILGLVINLFHIDPIKALIYSAVLNCVIAPVIIILVVLISGSRKIMGKWANRPSTNFAGWVIVGIMALASLGGILGIVL